MTKRIFAILLLLSTTMFTNKVDAQLNLNYYMNVGRTRISNGNLTGAIEYFNIIIKFKPYLPEPYFYRGVAKHQLEDYRGAIADYDKALSIKPFFPEVLKNRGLAYHALGDTESALKDYEKALEFNPYDDGIYNNLGLTQMASKDYDNALKSLNKAIELNPRATNSYMNRSNVKALSGDMKGAIQDLNQVIIIKPFDSRAYLNRGLAYLENKDYARSLRDLDKAISLDNKNAMAYNNRGIAKHQLGDLEGAISDYSKALELDPTQAGAYYNRGVAKAVSGSSDYKDDLDFAKRLNPSYGVPVMAMDGDSVLQSGGNFFAGIPTHSPPADSTLADNSSNSGKASSNKKKSEEAKKDPSLELLKLKLSDSRNVPRTEEEIAHDSYYGLIQNERVNIDLRPMFMVDISTESDLSVGTSPYYWAELERLNVFNNYQPKLSLKTSDITTKTPAVYLNYALFFKERADANPITPNYLTLSVFELLGQNYESAINSLNKVIDGDKSNEIAYLLRGNARMQLANQILMSMNTMGGLSPSVSINDKNEGADLADFEALSKNRMDIEDFNLAKQDYDKALETHAESFFVYYNRGYLQAQVGNIDAAISDFKKAIDIQPDLAEAYFNLGILNIIKGETRDAGNYLSKSGELGISDSYNIIKRYCNSAE
ncbi:MAG: tetratricopeptide repeat protein [Bacteroidales bacterium]